MLSKSKKYLFYYRGTKEVDFFVGKYLDAYSSQNDISELEKMCIKENDIDIFTWVIGADTSPKEYQNLIIKIRQSLHEGKS